MHSFIFCAFSNSCVNFFSSRTSYHVFSILDHQHVSIMLVALSHHQRIVGDSLKAHATTDKHHSNNKLAAERGHRSTPQSCVQKGFESDIGTFVTKKKK